jgi:hypothetical protein
MSDMIDPRLNDCGLTYEQRQHYSRHLLPVDHPQLWKDSALIASAERHARWLDERATREFAQQVAEASGGTVIDRGEFLEIIHAPRPYYCGECEAIHRDSTHCRA